MIWTSIDAEKPEEGRDLFYFFSFLGILAILLGLVALAISKLGNKTGNLEWMNSVSKVHGLSLLVIGVFLSMMSSLFFFADRGFNYLLVSPTGNMSAVMEQGIKWRGFAKIDKWQKFIDVKVVGKGNIKG